MAAFYGVFWTEDGVKVERADFLSAARNPPARAAAARRGPTQATSTSSADEDGAVAADLLVEPQSRAADLHDSRLDASASSSRAGSR